MSKEDGKGLATLQSRQWQARAELKRPSVHRNSTSGCSKSGKKNILGRLITLLNRLQLPLGHCAQTEIGRHGDVVVVVFSEWYRVDAKDQHNEVGIVDTFNDSEAEESSGSSDDNDVGELLRGCTAI